jgi:hypothetical protein
MKTGKMGHNETALKKREPQIRTTPLIFERFVLTIIPNSGDLDPGIPPTYRGSGRAGMTLATASPNHKRRFFRALTNERRFFKAMHFP